MWGTHFKIGGFMCPGRSCTRLFTLINKSASKHNFIDLKNCYLQNLEEKKFAMWLPYNESERKLEKVRENYRKWEKIRESVRIRESEKIRKSEKIRES